MLTEDRYEYILENINRNNSVKLKDLVDILGTSESTVRRDLDELEARGFLKRVRGGAISSSNFTQDISINTRKHENTDSKIALGRYCASLVEDGDCLYLDAGTTTNEIIPFLKGKDIVVVTNGIHNIDRLVENKIRSLFVLSDFQRKLAELNNHYRIEANDLDEIKSNLNSYTESYEKTILEIGVCPFCYSEINNDSIEHIKYHLRND